MKISRKNFLINFLILFFIGSFSFCSSMDQEDTEKDKQRYRNFIWKETFKGLTKSEKKEFLRLCNKFQIKQKKNSQKCNIQ